MRGPRLPAAPMAAWISSQSESIKVLAERSGLSTSTLTDYRDHANETVSLDAADRLLCSNRVNLDEVWGDLDTLLGLPVVV